MRLALNIVDGSRMVASLEPGSRIIRLVPVDEALDALQARAAVWLQGTGSLKHVCHQFRESFRGGGEAHVDPA
jgi:hypothetical protein